MGSSIPHGGTPDRKQITLRRICFFPFFFPQKWCAPQKDLWGTPVRIRIHVFWVRRLHCERVGWLAFDYLYILYVFCCRTESLQSSIRVCSVILFRQFSVLLPPRFGYGLLKFTLLMFCGSCWETSLRFYLLALCRVRRPVCGC